jgi:LuxR family maltose regulon positive regulatory protein
VQVALLQGDLPGAAAWAEQAGQNADAHPFYPFLGLTPARLLLAQNRKAAALEYLQSCFEMAVHAGWGYGRITVRIMQALAAARPEEAHDRLIQALTWAQPEGFIRTFADAGAPLVPLLQEAALRGITPDYVGEILAAIGEKPRTITPDLAPLVEPLSEREIEVLRLVVAGLSNREIAGKLILSLGTVKTHIHNIYGKLDARNRAQVIARARELNLI